MDLHRKRITGDYFAHLRSINLNRFTNKNFLYTFIKRLSFFKDQFALNTERHVLSQDPAFVTIISELAVTPFVEPSGDRSNQFYR